jgi:hypothetical protein
LPLLVKEGVGEVAELIILNVMTNWPTVEISVYKTIPATI